LGQNFAKAFDVMFSTKENKQEYVWATSWGVSTRLMGALVMTHSDDDGLVLPPALAPIQVVMVPIYKTDEEYDLIVGKLNDLASALKIAGVTVKVDSDRQKKPGWKFAEWELKGVPVRIALGPRDLEQGNIEMARRDTKEKASLPIEGIVDKIAREVLPSIQSNLHQRALEMRNSRTYRADTYAEFKEILEQKGGFILAHWDGTPETEQKIKEETKATIRCIPLDSPSESGTCIYTGKPSERRVLFAEAY
jgi:prolyl-tRNA synthetase